MDEVKEARRGENPSIDRIWNQGLSPLLLLFSLPACVSSLWAVTKPDSIGLTLGPGTRSLNTSRKAGSQAHAPLSIRHDVSPVVH